MKSSVSKQIDEAVAVLQKGGVIALPTETTYGLACDPRKAEAVKKIFKIKGRSEKKPLQLIASSMVQVRSLAILSGGSKALADAYWPGPLTLLLRLKKGKRLASEVCPNRVIGIRVTSSETARKLVRAYGHPIAATSANRSGNTPAFSDEEVREAFKGCKHRPDFVMSAGPIPKNKPSTVARVEDDGSITVIRKGAVKL